MRVDFEKRSAFETPLFFPFDYVNDKTSAKRPQFFQGMPHPTKNILLGSWLPFRKDVCLELSVLFKLTTNSIFSKSNVGAENDTEEFTTFVNTRVC